MKHINRIFLIVLSIGITFTSCKKGFLDVNDDPNRVTEQNITPELIFTQAEVAVGDLAAGNSAQFTGFKSPTQFLQNWIGYMSGNGDFAIDPTETTYNIDFSFNNTLWGNYYATLFDLHQAETKGLITGDTAVTGASMILSAKLFQELVDLFGDIPYSQAFHVATTTRPAYDKGQDVYNSLLLRLDTAITYMQKGPSSKFSSADVINQGNNDLWIKFANTLKLRLLIRQSEVSGFNPAPEIAKIISNGGVLEAGENIDVNPNYANDVNKQNPYYANYGFTPSGTKAITSTNPNAYIVDILKSNNDPRIGQFFTTVGGQYVGATYGDQPGNNPTGAQSSYFGPGLIPSPTGDQWILPAYESLFFKAEAIARGWLPGDAQQAYEEAVTESFVFLGVPNATSEAANYLSSSAIADWSNAGSSVGSRVRFIAFQKYIANTGLDALESYSDERRLHFLTDKSYISANPARVSNTLPLRVLYPQSEYTTNSENVLKEGTIDPFTSKIFWEP